MSLFHKVDRDIKREGGGGDEGVRERNREGARERRRDGDGNGREGLAFSRFYVHVCCVQREVMLVVWTHCEQCVVFM